jgi:hypothetical protein
MLCCVEVQRGRIKQAMQHTCVVQSLPSKVNTPSNKNAT